MANVIIFHSILGIRRGILDLSKMLKEDGHQVFTVDLYNGYSFDNMQEAFDFFLGIGKPEMMNRTIKYTKDLPNDSVYIGFSNGGVSAMLLAGTKPEAKGCILLHAALPLSELGIKKWISSIPVQVHYAKVDPWKNEESVVKLEIDIVDSGASYQYYEYPLVGHLFTDAEMPEYSKECSDLLFKRVVSFIHQCEKGLLRR